MDARRHSVDIPISKTLVALRRVRSLRDPSTNSMSKFSSLVDNLNWDTNSCNGISLRFGNGYKEGISGNNGWDLSKVLGTCGEEEETTKDIKSNECSPKSNSKSNVRKNSGVKSKKENGDRLPTQRHCSDRRENGLELACISPPDDHLEGGDSNHDSTPIGGKIHSSKQNGGYSYMRSLGSMGDLVSRVGTTSLCGSETMLDGSTCSPSLFATDEIDALDRDYRGCGLTCCWSKTPRYRDINLASDGEDYPLISGETGETDMSWKHIDNEIVTYSESPRTLSQKFRPKSFDELVGQSVATRSLSGAISRGRITSFYLFHGPRGAGKTSASRIFAAALNCLSQDEHGPCGSCQECTLYFAGKSRDVKEVDSVRINRAGRLRSLIKSATLPPVSSKFKIFIVDECHLLRGDTWATFLTNMDSISQHVVFVMITPDLDKLPRSVVARSQRYHFPKLKEVDIGNRLRRICVEEGLEFEEVALEFIAAKSNGSMRDAEIVLDQLSLLGSYITMTLVYELVGTVSDDELLDLLDLALSTDTSNTVRKARAIMRSRIDPMQLISQLANIIMDVLAGKCQEDDSEVRRNFLRRHASDTDLQKLRHALKILSESEKQLRMSKNQTTWLTVALLQLNSMDSSLSDPNASRLFVRTANSDGDCCSTSSPDERSKHLVSYDSADVELSNMVTQGQCQGTLESIWIRATEICHPNSRKNFLRKRGKLSSVWMKKDLAVAELEFDNSDYASNAEKSWKSIASSLQSVLGCNVEIRINVPPSCAKAKRTSFSLFSCSRRIHKSQTATESGSDRLSNASNFTSDRAMIGDRHVDTCSSCGSQISHICSHRMVSTLRNSDGNALSTGRSGASTPPRVSQDGMLSALGTMTHSTKETVSKILTVEEQEIQPNCFPKTLKLNKKLGSSKTSEVVCLKVQPKDKTRAASFDTYICTDYPYILSNSCNNSDISQHEDGCRKPKESKSHCWRTPPLPTKKAWQMKHQRQISHLVEWVLPCAAAK